MSRPIKSRILVSRNEGIKPEINKRQVSTKDLGKKRKSSVKLWGWLYQVVKQKNKDKLLTSTLKEVMTSCGSANLLFGPLSHSPFSSICLYTCLTSLLDRTYFLDSYCALVTFGSALSLSGRRNLVAGEKCI